MKLAYIITKYPCKSEAFASREISEMLRIGHDITILTAAKDSDLDANSFEPKTIYRTCLFSRFSLKCVFLLTAHYPLGTLRLALFFLRLVFINIREALSLLRNIGTIASFVYHLDQLKITHLHAYFLSWPALMAVAISKITRCTFSISAHARDIFVESGALVDKIKPANFVAVCSKAGYDALQQRLPTSEHSKLHLIHHGLDHLTQHTQQVTDDTIERISPYDIIGMGRLVEKKGFRFLLMAFALIKETNPDTQLVIVGDGPEKKLLIQAATALGISKAVQFTGWLAKETANAILQNTKILAVPSIISHDGDQDGIPNVILEAYAGGTPVIASRCGGISEVLEHLHTGWLVEPNNVKELTAAMNTLLQDNHLRNELQKNAKHFCRQHFDIRNNIQLLSQLMEQCVAK